MAVVITAVVLLGMALVVAVGRDPGPGVVDVAIGYARALGAADFDAVYRMVDPELLRGRNRQVWIADARARPRLTLRPELVVAAAPPRVDGDAATVDLDIGGDGPVTVELVRRQRIWTVVSFAGASAAPRTDTR